MNKNELPGEFTSTLSRKEAMLILPYIVLHVFALPYGISALFPQLDETRLNVAIYGFGMFYMLVVGRGFLRRDFDALCDYLPLIMVTIISAYIRMMISNYGANDLLYYSFDAFEGKADFLPVMIIASLLLILSPIIQEWVKKHTKAMERRSFIATGIWAVVQLAALYICVNDLAVRLMNTVEGNPNTGAVIEMAQSESGLIFGVSVFMAPIVEELIFRAGVFGVLRKRNRVLAYFVSILMFSFYHIAAFVMSAPINVLYILQYLPISFLLCRSYEKTNCIWTSIFLHMAVNAVSMQILQMI